MEMIVQLITEEIRVVEFHSPHPKFFRCGSMFSDMGDCINSEQHVFKQFAANTELCYFSGRASVWTRVSSMQAATAQQELTMDLIK